MTQTGLDYLKLVESNRHNVATEGQAVQELDETRRTHLANEDIAREGNQINLITATANAKNADTNYLNYEVNKRRADTDYLNYTVNKYDSRTRRKQYNLDRYYKTNMVRQGDQQLKETATHNRHTEGLKSKEIDTSYLISQQTNDTKKLIASDTNQTSRTNTKTRAANDYKVAEMSNATKGQIAAARNAMESWLGKYKTDQELGFKYTKEAVTAAIKVFGMFQDMFDIGDQVKDLMD